MRDALIGCDSRNKADCTSSALLQRLAGRGFCSDRAQNAPVKVSAVDGFDLHDRVRFLLTAQRPDGVGFKVP